MYLQDRFALPSSELHAMKLDGILDFTLTAIDSPPTWQSRSSQLLFTLERPAVLTGLSAAWALGMSDEPTQHTAAYVSIHRQKYPKKGLIRFEERYFSTGDLWLDGDWGITTPLRTTIDMLKSESIPESILELFLRLLVYSYDIQLQELLQELQNNYKMPYKQRAVSRLRKYYPSDTR